MHRVRTLAPIALMATVLSLLRGVPVALANDEDIHQQIEALQEEIDALKKRADESERTSAQISEQTEQISKTTELLSRKSLGRWLEFGGDYRFRLDSLRGDVPGFYSLMDPNFVSWLLGQMNGAQPAPPPAPTRGFSVKNDTLYTNRLGLNLKAKATQDVSVTVRLLMYKAAGSQDDAPVTGSGVGPFFADRAGLFDGTIGHVPGDNKLAVDRAYATWSNIADQPIWFSIGRRPSTGGVPMHLKQNLERPGNSGVPALLVDYAFDGVTLGYAPDLDLLTGAYAKFCYGRGFSNSITETEGNGLHNTDMLGINIVPYDTDPLRIEFQYNRGFNIFNSPIMLTGPFAGSGPRVDLGDIDWFGFDVLGNVKHLPLGSFNWFVSTALSETRPNGKLFFPFAGRAPNTPGVGLLYNQGEDRVDKTGWAIFVGGRYDIEATRTKLGFEFNHGSKDWITFAPAADDIWTSKVGTRGEVYDVYVIQELPLKPVASYFSRVFFKVGYQYYDFAYTGSNNWVGSPVKISRLLASPNNAQMFTPLENAQDFYATFEVQF